MKLLQSFLFAIFLLVICPKISFSQSETRPNVIIILTDDQGYKDVGITGNPHVKTPASADLQSVPQPKDWNIILLPAGNFESD